MSFDPATAEWKPYIGEPWKRSGFDKRICQVEESDGRVVVAWAGFDGTDFDKDAEALVMFIAAAPAMYAELTRLLDVVSPSDRERITAVLERAKGETT